MARYPLADHVHPTYIGYHAHGEPGRTLVGPHWHPKAAQRTLRCRLALHHWASVRMSRNVDGERRACRDCGLTQGRSFLESYLGDKKWR